MIELMGPAASYETPLALMTACHRRVEQRLDMLPRIADALETGPEAARREALIVLEQVRLYFATSGAHHTQDEEQSLFPMLRATGDPWLLATMEALEGEHTQLDPAHAEFDALCQRLTASGGADPQELARLRALIATFRATYPAHIRIEDELLFPRAQALLTPEQIARLAEELRDRRSPAR